MRRCVHWRGTLARRSNRDKILHIKENNETTIYEEAQMKRSGAGAWLLVCLCVVGVGMVGCAVTPKSVIRAEVLKCTEGKSLRDKLQRAPGLVEELESSLMRVSVVERSLKLRSGPTLRCVGRWRQELAALVVKARKQHRRFQDAVVAGSVVRAHRSYGTLAWSYGRHRLLEQHVEQCMGNRVHHSSDMRTTLVVRPAPCPGGKCPDKGRPSSM